MSEVIRLEDRRDYNHHIQMLKEKLEAEHLVIVSVNKDGTFGSMVDYDIKDIDLCYAIDCLKERRRVRNEEING